MSTYTPIKTGSSKTRSHNWFVNLKVDFAIKQRYLVVRLSVYSLHNMSASMGETFLIKMQFF